MEPAQQNALHLTRRHFFGRTSTGIGSAALASLLNPGLLGGRTTRADLAATRAAHRYAGWKGGVLDVPHHPPSAKRVIYLFMSGAPSQIDLFDYKPKMTGMFDTDLPQSVRMGQRLTTMTSGQARFPIAPSLFKFHRAGERGTWISELLPKTASIVDDLTVIRSMYTEAINHDPAITYIQTGHQIPGRPSAGAWVSYGLGSPNDDLPAFVVMTPFWNGRKEAQALYNRLWGSGFLPSKHQGVALRSQGDPVLYLSNPPGVDRSMRRTMLDGLAELNQLQFDVTQDPEINTRIAQYEMAYRMQMSVPRLTDFSNESRATLEMYGPEVHKPGSFAASCLLARRMAERGVPFVQLFIRGWDHHGNLPKDIKGSCFDIDQPSAALVQDLKLRGLLDDTLVIWGGEFGRTIYCQGTLTKTDYGRDHHPRCFTIWMAGGGIRRGLDYGQTDEFSYNVIDKPVHVHDLNATILHCLGIDHERLTFRFQGRDYRLTDVHGNVVREILS